MWYERVDADNVVGVESMTSPYDRAKGDRTMLKTWTVTILTLDGEHTIRMVGHTLADIIDMCRARKLNYTRIDR